MEKAQERDSNGRRLATRHGHLPSREIQSGLGPIALSQPRIRDQRPGQSFASSILPPYLRRLPSVDAAIPALYLAGVSTGQFEIALEALLGPQAKGLSPTNITRLKAQWEEEYEEWSQRSLEGKRFAYIWADAVYPKVRLAQERPCLLVLMGALEDGTKELIGLSDGERESSLSWEELFSGLNRRGFTTAPNAVFIGDGGLGLWAAVAKSFPGARQQRCWVHKTANVLNKLPKKIQVGAKIQLQQIYQAETRKDAEAAIDEFEQLYGAKYPKATKCLRKDEAELLTFYDYPAEHWVHLWTTNPIESVFTTVRHRLRQTKGGGSRRGYAGHGFQALLGSFQTLETASRLKADSESRIGSEVQRRSRGGKPRSCRLKQEGGRKMRSITNF